MTEYDNRQIGAYHNQQTLKQHQQEQISIIKADYPEFCGTVLDIGCANGTFIEAMRAVYPTASYTGIDLSEELIELARRRLPGDDVSLFVENVLSYQPAAGFDIIVASGVLSIFEDHEPVLKKWLSWMNSGGRLYIFGRFNSKNIDTIVRFRNNYNQGDWEGGLTSYSIQTVSRVLEQSGYKHAFKRFTLNMELAEGEDPIRTYTVNCQDGTTLVLNGANTVAEHYFLTVTR